MTRTTLAAVLAAFGMAACSGGGGPPPAPVGLAPDRTTITCSADPGVLCVDTVLAQPGAPGHASFVASDKAPDGQSRAVEDVDYHLQPDGRGRISVFFRSDLPPGTYIGTIDVNLSMGPNGPAYRATTLHYQFTQAGAQGDLRALPAAALPDWQTLGGQATHRGSVDVALDPARFTRRFTVGGPDIGAMSRPATSGGRVFVTGTPAPEFTPGVESSTLRAFDEATGALAWALPFPAWAEDPAAEGDRVFIRSQDDRGVAWQAIDATDGTRLHETVQPYDRPWRIWMHAATPAGGAAYVGEGGAVAAYQPSGAGWNIPLRDSLDPSFSWWTPAVTDTQVFTNVNGRFRALRRSDGAEQFSLTVAGPTSGSLQTLHELHHAPVIVDADSVLLLDRRRQESGPVANQLSMVDLPTRQVRWTASGYFTTQPVALDGLVVVGNEGNRTVEARSAATGDLLWQWAPGHEPGQVIGDLLLTRNLLFVSAGPATYAIDLQTRQRVWTYPMGGSLAMSARGVLYIVSSDRDRGDHLVAINLR